MPHEEHETDSPQPDGKAKPDGEALPHTQAVGEAESPVSVTAATSVSATPDASADAPPEDGHLWFAVVAGSRLGPFSTEDIRRRLQNGDLRARHFVWRLGFGPHWYRLREVPEFRAELDQLSPQQPTSQPGMPERILCTNCYARVLPAWHECPCCGHRLKQEPPTAPQILAADFVHRVIGLAGAVLLLVAVVLPWLSAGTARVAGLEGYLGASFGLLAVALGFFAAQAALGRTSRPVLTLALTLWGVALMALYLLEVHAESAAIFAQLNLTAAEEVPRGLGLLGAGAWLYLVGLLLLVAACLLPAVHALLRRPVPGAATLVAIVVAALVHLQLVNGNLYAPLIEARLTLQGYEVVSLERQQDDDDDTAAAHTSSFVRAEQGLGSASHTYVILARDRDEGRLYRARLSIPLGSLFPLRTIPLQRIPIEDQPLFDHPVEMAPTEDGDENNNNAEAR